VRRASGPPCPRRASTWPTPLLAGHASRPRGVDPLQRLSRPTGGPSVTQAEPCVVGRIRRFPRFLVPATTYPSERHVRRTVTSTAAPPPGFLTLSAVSSQARGRGLRPARLRADLHAATVQDLVSPSGLHPQESRTPPGAAGSLVVRFTPRSSATRRALISLDFPRRPRPSGPPTPEAPSVTSCVLECGRPRRGGRSPSRARATSPHEPELVIPRHPPARRTVLTLAALRRPRSVLPPACPTPFPGVATGSWVVALLGSSPPEP